MPPLATIDLVGWDVHKAIVDNVHANTKDEAHDAFALPTYMDELIDHGHLGNKTPEHGGFYRRVKEGKQTINLVLDPKTGALQGHARERLRAAAVRREDDASCTASARYADAIKVFVAAEGAEADLARKVILGYVSYGLNRVGDNEVVRERARRRSHHGLRLQLGAAHGAGRRHRREGDHQGARDAADCRCRRCWRTPKPGERLFREPHVNIGRFFAA